MHLSWAPEQESKVKKKYPSPPKVSITEEKKNPNQTSYYPYFYYLFYNNIYKALCQIQKQTLTSIFPAEIYNLITGYGIGEETCPRSHSRYTAQIRMSILPDTLSSPLPSNSHCLPTPLMTNKQRTYLEWQEGMMILQTTMGPFC